MAEALVVVGLIANIISLLDYGEKIVSRLGEFQSQTEDIPKTFRDLKTELPLLLKTLDETKQQAEAGMIDIDTQVVLLPVVDGCHKQVKELERILAKALPTKEDKRWQVGMKAIISVYQDKKVKAIVDTLRGYMATLTHNQVTRLGGLDLKKYLHTTRSLSPRPETRAVFSIPFDRDYGYIDRTGIISELDERVKTRRRVGLSGIGGVGKSQIAIEYCYRFHERNPLANVFWVHAASLPRFDKCYRGIARKLSLPGWDELDLNTFQTVCDWLSDPEHGSWLMVLDSADDLDLFFKRMSKTTGDGADTHLSRFIPRSPLGTVIMTTRDRRVAERITDRQSPIMVFPMSSTEGEELLRSKLPEEFEVDQSDARDLVVALGNLPLAISQAAAFITEYSMDVREYLGAFKSDVSEVQDLLSQDLGDHRRDVGDEQRENSILSTWKLSFDQISLKHPRAAEVLSFMAVLDRVSIPKSLLINNEERTIDLALALGTLQAFSLIVVEKKEAFGLHRLVQISTRRWLELQGTLRTWQETALRVLSERFPTADYGNWQQCELLSPHAQEVISYNYESKDVLVRRAKILDNLARFDFQQSRYSLAFERYEEVIRMRKEFLGPEEPDTLGSMCSLGQVLFHQSRYSDAERMLRESLAKREKLLGMDHSDTKLNVGHLAEVVRGLRRYDEAEALYKRALAGREDDLGNDLIAMKNMDNLGSVLRDAGRLDEAEKWVRKAFDARERYTGEFSLPTLGSVSHLAMILRLRGNLDEAEMMNKRALAGFERVLGREHHFTLRSLDDLAIVFRCQGKLDAAEEQNRRALGGLAKVLGPTHRRTLASTKHLALILQLKSRYNEAESLLKTVLQAQERDFGRDSYQTQETLQDLDRVIREREQHTANKLAETSLTSDRPRVDINAMLPENPAS